MAKEQIITEFQVVLKNGDKTISSIQAITGAFDKAGDAAKAAFSGKVIDQTTEQLEKFNIQVEKTAAGLRSAKGELIALTNKITFGELQGKDLQVAIKRAAELKDKIADVKEEIGRLASDTRIFDTFVEGGRAVAAAFSIAQGAAALFGEENKDLQKALLKTQGALALLTGVQQAAEIATKKGGLATTVATAAQSAYTFVVGASTGALKAFRIALAATGIGAAILLVAELVANWDKLSAAVKEYFGIKTTASSEQVTAEIDRIKAIQGIYEDEIELKRAAGEDVRKLELQRIQNLRDILKEVKPIYQQETEFYKFQADLRHDLNVKEAALKKQIRDEEEKAADDLKKKNEANDIKVIEEQQKLADARANQLDKEIADAKAKNDAARVAELEARKAADAKQIEQADKYAADELARLNALIEQKKALQAAYFSFAQSSLSSLSAISNSFFAQESQTIQTEKELQLKQAGDNAKQREAIEKKFVIKQAELKRKQAIAEKAFAITSIGINLAMAIQKITAEAAVLAANPLTAALAANSGAQIGLAVAAASLATAAIIAQPLPEIPKFAEGVIGLKRGKNKPGIDTVPALLTEGESVMTVASTNKYKDELQAAQDLQLEDLIYHKYLLPALKQAGAADKEGNLYDDWNLRRTIKKEHETDREHSKLVADAILEGMRSNNYLINRHKN